MSVLFMKFRRRIFTTVICFLVLLAVIFAAHFLSYRATFASPLTPPTELVLQDKERDYTLYGVVEDSEVIASQSGRITSIGLDETKEHYQIVVEHLYGLRSLYRNLNKEDIFVSVGQTVQKGQALASLPAVNLPGGGSGVVHKSALNYSLSR